MMVSCGFTASYFWGALMRTRATPMGCAPAVSSLATTSSSCCWFDRGMRIDFTREVMHESAESAYASPLMATQSTLSSALVSCH